MENGLKCLLAAAAAAKSLQSCLTLCDPIDGSPPGSPVPGILQARTLEWVAISFSSAWKWNVKVKSLSRAWLVATPWTGAYEAPPSMGFSRHEGGPTQKMRREERPARLNFGSSFSMFFLFPLSLPCVNWASLEGCLFHLFVSPVLGPSFVLFSRAFPFFVLSPPPSWTTFSYSNYLTPASPWTCNRFLIQDPYSGNFVFG